MKPDVNELVEAALKLPVEARGALASRLIQSLDEAESDPDAEEAWAAEIRRRVEEIESGKVEMVPWEEARRQILRDD